MENFRIINYDEGIFTIDDKLNDTSFKDKKLTIGISPTLKYKGDRDVLGIKLDVGYILDNERIMTYGMALTVKYDGFVEILKESKADENINTKIKDVWKSAISFTRGALCVKTKDTKLERIILPEPNYDLLLENVRVERT